MLRAETVPAFEGKGASFQDYVRRARSGMRVSKMGPSGRASALETRVNSVARQACPSAGGDHADSSAGAPRLLDFLRNYFAPGTADSIYVEVVRVTRYRQAGRAID